jgi:alkyl sulfatase BDS1-like metallo-beta-lactamase superfamily hydrolase
MSDLPFADRTDFENAKRGFVDALDPCVVTAADGRVVWDLEAYAYLDSAPPTPPSRSSPRDRERKRRLAHARGLALTRAG